MAFAIGQREVDGIVVLDLDGRLVAGAPVADLRGRIDQLMAAKRANVVLNLKHVEFIDSSGLGTLVAGHSALKNAGGTLALVNLPKRSAELLILTKLWTVFRIFNDERSAVDSFFPDRDTKPFDILAFVRENKPKRK